MSKTARGKSNVDTRLGEEIEVGKVKKVNFEIYIADRKATTFI